MRGKPHKQLYDLNLFHYGQKNLIAREWLKCSFVVRADGCWFRRKANEMQCTCLQALKEMKGMLNDQ